MRLIDADDINYTRLLSQQGLDMELVPKAVIDNMPSVDAVEVVRCRECIYRDQSFRCIALYFGFNPHDDWFCANGKRDAEVEG